MTSASHRPPRSADLIALTHGPWRRRLCREARVSLGRSRPQAVIALLRAPSSELGSKLASARHELTLQEHDSWEIAWAERGRGQLAQPAAAREANLWDGRSGIEALG